MVKLKGITGHGKNRIREHGQLWEVLELPPGVVSMSNKPALPPVKSVKSGVWRWLDEKNFEIIENNCLQTIQSMVDSKYDDEKHNCKTPR